MTADQAAQPVSKPIHGAPQPKNIPFDMQTTPPSACGLKVGDRVIYTNSYGAKFQKTVRGFSGTAQGLQFVYLDLDCWWSPVSLRECTLVQEVTA